MSAVLTMGGAALSAGVLAVNVRSWWKGKRELAAAVPFGGGLIQGASWLLCTGGVLGWAALGGVSATNAAGDGTVRGATGTGGGVVAAGSMGRLSPPGACILVIVVILGFVAFKAASKKAKWKMFGGLLCGATLCAAAGVAHLMQWLPTVYNWLGAHGQALLSGVWSAL